MELTPLAKEIAKRVLEKYEFLAGYHLGAGFNTVYILVQAIEIAQSFDPVTVRDTLENMKSIDTTFSIGKLGGLATYGIKHTVCHPLPIQLMTDGEVKHIKWVDVYTP